MARIVARLGEDPLRAAGADAERAIADLARRRVPIGAALLDQRIIAGLGNGFRAEAPLAVYGRETCRRCGSEIGTVTLAGRPRHRCPGCQR